MVILRSDSASQLQREPGHRMFIPPITVPGTSPQYLVVPYHVMKVMFPRETMGVNASRAAVMEEDRMEETAEMGMEVEVPLSPSIDPDRRNKNKKKVKKGHGDGDGGDDPDKDPEDSDDKFVRRMKKFLGGGFNTGNSDDNQAQSKGS